MTFLLTAESIVDSNPSWSHNFDHIASQATRHPRCEPAKKFRLARGIRLILEGYFQSQKAVSKLLKRCLYAMSYWSKQ